MNRFEAMLASLADQPVVMPPRRPVGAPKIDTSRTDELRYLLDRYTCLSTLALASAANLSIRQVWGLLKGPRANGEVRFEHGQWSLNPNYECRAMTAARLLTERGWKVVPPEARHG